MKKKGTAGKNYLLIKRFFPYLKKHLGYGEKTDTASKGAAALPSTAP